jgi:protein-S-isoprenylcysteine O-methyltransferase Ste14
MGIGAGIFLIVIGAIITFALNVETSFMDLSVVGWVLMVAGVVGILLQLWFWSSRKRSTTVVQQPQSSVQSGQTRTTVEPAPHPDDRVDGRY